MSEALVIHPDCCACLAHQAYNKEEAVLAVIKIVNDGLPIEQIVEDLCRVHRKQLEGKHG